jgi:peptidoglycan/LPS O-acetylase OafA/YrhL
VAVLLVLIYHAGLPLHHGYVGVDVFFVISGFLITSILLRELARDGRIDWPRFVGRRARRLLPAAITVLGVTAAVAWFAVPGLRRRDIGVDIAASALYSVNWVFADRAVDYLASDARPSPVQHFWSLAVEEQFYVLWPLALIALAVVVRRFGRRRRMPSRRAVALVLSAIAVPSFGYAVWLGGEDPSRSYFVTTTRVWELGVGAALAVALSGREPVEGGVRTAVAGWAGLGAVLGGAVLLPDRVAWPGPWTLLPTVGAAAVLYAGWARARGGPAVLLRAAPLVWIGGLSYSLYLWHWPAVVLAEWVHEGLTPVQRACVVLLSVAPAWLGYRFLERPVHHSRALAERHRVSLGVGAALSAVGVLVAVPLVLAPSPFRTAPVAGTMPGVTTLGAARLQSPPSREAERLEIDDWAWLVPDPQLAGQDRPKADVDHCQVDRRSEEPVPCEFGVPGGPTTVALVGDSKAMQWLPALEELATARGWRIVTYGKSACAFAAGTAVHAGQPYPACDAWNARVMEQLRADPPDVLLTSGYANQAWDGQAASADALVTGLAQRWGEVAAMGTPVVVVGDSPLSPDDLDICTARHPRHLTRCAFERDAAVAGSGLPVQREAAVASRTALVDLTPWICPTEQCPVAIGHVAVHRSGDHLTATYVATLAPVLGARLDEVLARSPH